MNQALARILIAFILLGLSVAPSRALVVNAQNQIFAQPGEMVTVTCLSAASARRDQIFNMYTPTSRFSLTNTPSRVGATINLGTFSKSSELVFELLDPRTGFGYFNDARNNIDLENHIRITDLGGGKLRVGWENPRTSSGTGKFDDLVIIIQGRTPAKPAVVKSAGLIKVNRTPVVAPVAPKRKR